MKNIKLVVSDMDGTLLDSHHRISPQFKKIFHQLKEKGILFIAASGRPYYSIKNKLKNVDDRLTIIAENGGLVVKDEQVIIANTIDKTKLQELYDVTTSIEHTHPIFCTKDMAFIYQASKELVATFSEYYSNYKIIETYDQIEGEVIKIALYHSVDSETFIFPHVKHYKDEFNVVVSGNHWVDISNTSSNKGEALRYIQNHLNISPSETMVFGDYNNDLEMLQEAHYSYAMANAHEDVKKVSNFLTKSNDELGVEIVLEELLAVNR